MLPFSQKCSIGRTQSSFLTNISLFGADFFFSENTDAAVWRSSIHKRKWKMKAKKQVRRTNVDKKPN